MPRCLQAKPLMLHRSLFSSYVWSRTLSEQYIPCCCSAVLSEQNGDAGTMAQWKVVFESLSSYPRADGRDSTQHVCLQSMQLNCCSKTTPCFRSLHANVAEISRDRFTRALPRPRPASSGIPSAQLEVQYHGTVAVACGQHAAVNHRVREAQLHRPPARAARCCLLGPLKLANHTCLLKRLL